ACELLPGRRDAGGEPVFDGRGRSDGHQTVAYYDRPDLGRNVDRPIWRRRWRPYRAPRFDISLCGDNLRATTTARGAKQYGAINRHGADGRGRPRAWHAEARAVEF